MTGPAMRISVVIPTIGRPVLADVATAVMRQDPFELIVVADAHSAQVRAVLAGCGLDDDPRVRVVAGPGGGPAPARQTGVEHSNGDLVVLLDDDVVPDPGLLLGHRQVHESVSDAVVVGYIPVAPEITSHSVTSTIYSRDYESACDALVAAPRRVLPALWGGNISLRRSDCLRVPQAVDSFRGLLLEDTEFGLRCLRAGLVGIFDRKISAVHYHEQTVEEFLRASERQAHANRVLCTQYPDIAIAHDPTAGLPGYAVVVLRAHQLPIVGPWMLSLTRFAALRAGRKLTPRRVKIVGFARVAVQIAQTRRESEHAQGIP